MGDRYTFNIKCAYCKKLNKDVYYADSCNINKFTCKFCKKRNKIVIDFYAEKIEKKVKKEKVIHGDIGYQSSSGFVANRRIK